MAPTPGRYHRQVAPSPRLIPEGKKPGSLVRLARLLSKVRLGNALMRKIRPGSSNEHFAQRAGVTILAKGRQEQAEALMIEPESFRGTPATFLLAQIVQSETAIARTKPFTNALLTLAMSKEQLSQEIAKAATAPWYVLLKNILVVRRCAHRAGLQEGDFLERVVFELVPPNWEVLFWIAEWHKLLSSQDAPQELKAATMETHARAERAAWGSLGGKAKHQEASLQKQWVRDEWVKHGASQYGGNKTEFARVYVKLGLEKFGRQFAETTIAVAWLRGL